MSNFCPRCNTQLYQAYEDEPLCLVCGYVKWDFEGSIAKLRKEKWEDNRIAAIRVHPDYKMGLKLVLSRKAREARKNNMVIKATELKHPVVLPYPRDALRYKYFVRESNQHQAKMELRTFKRLVEMFTKPGDTILDPMSGVGTVHFANFMGRNSIAVEIVPGFVELQHLNIKKMREVFRHGDFYENFDNFGWDYTIDFPEHEYRGKPGTPTILEGDNRRHLPLKNDIDAVIFSPPYGSLWAFSTSNRDNKVAKEKNYVVGYDDNPQNIGNMKNYREYLTAMKIVYRKCLESLKPGGILVTVVKDYIQAGKRVPCSTDNLRMCIQAGLVPYLWIYRDASQTSSPFQVKARRERIAAGKHNPELDISLEDIIVVRKPGG
jgi:modification methylase